MDPYPPDRPLHHHVHPRSFPGLNSAFVEALSQHRRPGTIEALRDLIHAHEPRLAPMLDGIIGENVTDPHVAVRLLEIDEGITRLRALRELVILGFNRKAAAIFPLPPHISDRLVAVLHSDLTFTAEHHLPPHLAWCRFEHLDNLMPRDAIQRLNGLEALALEGVFEGRNLSVRRNVGRFLQILNNPGLRLFVHTLPHPPHHVELMTINGSYEIAHI